MAIALANLDAARPRVAVGYDTSERPSWRYHVPAIEQACDRLGVSARVRIYLSNSRRGRWLGSQHWDERAGEHVVMLAAWLSPDGASRTLWHELTHCAQTERGEDLYVDASSSRRARMSREQYAELPGEREASANERLAARYPLVTACAR